MSRIPEILRAFEALEAAHDDVDVDLMIRAVQRIGNKHSLVASQKRAIAMMVGANSVTGAEAEDFENSSAMVAPAHKRKKVGRYKFHDGEKCKYGDRCRFNHVGAAGNGHPLPAGHAPYYSPGTTQTPHTSVPAVPADDVAVVILAAMVAKMLTGIASHAQCSVAAVAEVLLTTLQRRRKMSAKRRKSRHDSGDHGCRLLDK